MATKGELLVNEAKKHIGKPYVFGANGPNSFDCSGFIKYVYNNAINYGMNARTAYDQQNLGALVTGTPMAGDLIFFKNTYNSGRTPNISHVGMYTGEGNVFIHASSSKGVTITDLNTSSYHKSHYYSTKRLISSNDTFSGEGSIPGSYVSDSPVDSVSRLAGGLPLTRVNEYIEEMTSAIKELDNSENSYCTLVDLTYGGEFRFYLPESFTESLPISWDTNASIQGRSVPPTGYNNSGPRSIPLEIVLAAGAGYYAVDGKDMDYIMDLMYKDINFVKSLVYPDYSSVIVQPPSVVLLSLGANIRLKGVVSNLNITYGKPIDSKNRAMVVTLSFTVSQVSDEPPGRLDIIAGNLRSY